MSKGVYPRGKDRYRISYDLGPDPQTGKRRHKFETVKGTIRDAQRVRRARLMSIETGSYVTPTKMTVAEWLERWLKNYASPKCSPRTCYGYQFVVRRYVAPIIGSIPLQALEPRHLEDLYAALRSKGCASGNGPLSGTSVRACHILIKQALAYAMKQGVLQRNVAELVTPPRKNVTSISAMTREQLDTFLKAAEETPYYQLFLTMADTGMRRGEALALRWKSVDLDMAKVSVMESGYKLHGQYLTKGPKSQHGRRQIALIPGNAVALRKHKLDQEALRAQLGCHLTDDDLVFSHADGSPFDPSTVTHAFQSISKRAGLSHFRLHDLRHTHATLMLQAEIHPKIVSERLGHSSIKITLDTYSHILPGLQEEAALRYEAFLRNGAPQPHVAKLLPEDVCDMVWAVNSE